MGQVRRLQLTMKPVTRRCFYVLTVISFCVSAYPYSVGCAEPSDLAVRRAATDGKPASQVRGDAPTEGLHCRVWTTAQTMRARRDAMPTTDRSVTITAAGNEWESFQIFLRSETPVHEINLLAGDLKGPKGTAIPASLARLYRCHQVRLTQPSAGHQRFGTFTPGWYPDGLIPFKHPLTRKPLSDARYIAVPFDLPAGQTHGFWIDVYVPPNTAAGKYEGKYTVTAGGELLAEIPVQLTVYGFELPRVASLVTEFGLIRPRLVQYYPRLQGRPSSSIDSDPILLQTRDLLKRHRINSPVPRSLVKPKPHGKGGYRFTDEQIAGLRTFIDQYNLNAVRVLNPLDHGAAAKVRLDEKSRKLLVAALAAYDDAYRRLDRPDVIFYWYILDEPSSAAMYRFIRSFGEATRETKTVVKVLVTEKITPEKFWWGSLYGAVDVWCPPFMHFDPVSAAKRQALGETVWVYTALNWWQIDYPLINFRASAWTAWHYDIPGLLYWTLLYWETSKDPWTQPLSYVDRAGLKFYGEGCLLYPARAVGFDGVVPTIRLKAIRDSIEDYEYLAILGRLGRQQEAREITTELLGSAAANPRPLLKKYTTPVLHHQARLRLAELIMRD